MKWVSPVDACCAVSQHWRIEQRGHVAEVVDWHTVAGVDTELRRAVPRSAWFCTGLLYQCVFGVEKCGFCSSASVLAPQVGTREIARSDFLKLTLKSGPVCIRRFSHQKHWPESCFFCPKMSFACQIAKFVRDLWVRRKMRMPKRGKTSRIANRGFLCIFVFALVLKRSWAGIQIL